ncbi:hypothetical protein U1Q18_010901 [Sarracenia purpurea var. burkii]
MAKGRKLTTSRSERFLGGYSYGQGQRMVSDESEFGEEDVWSSVDDMVGGGGGNDQSMMNGSRGEWVSRPATDSSRSVSIGSRRHVAREERHVGGLSLAFDDPGKTASSRIVHQYRGQGGSMATSAPVDVPDWSKIYRVDSVESLHDSDDGVDDGDFGMVPPHEYLAQEYRRMAANSVFEGVGRTLKGRDMSRVRDAVWSQTGFDG